MSKSKTHTTLFFLFLFLSFAKTSAFFTDIMKSCNSFLEMIPYKTCAVGIALLYCIREFPHFNAPDFIDGKCYSQYGKNTGFYVLHLHGWGVRAHAETFTKQAAEDVYIVSPRFSETTNRKIFASCLGQERDAIVALQAIHETHWCTDVINTVAHCRGATAFFTVISIISTFNHPILKRLGIDEEERCEILEKFKKGCSIIISPLLSVDLFLYRWFTKPIGTVIHRFIFPWLTRYEYNPHGVNVLKSLLCWRTCIPLCVILPEYDNFIGTNLRKEFVQALIEKNGQECTKVLILQNETKHWPLALRTMSYKELFLRFWF